MSDLFRRLLEARGVGRDFLEVKYEDLGDASDLSGVDEAVELISEVIDGGGKILVFGDYDADGVTASIVMRDALVMAGAKEVEVMLPNRFIDGYGMNWRLVEVAKKSGIKMVITVDCGSNNREIVEELMAAGILVIVTDHHEVGGELPETVVVNPKKEGGVKDGKNSLKELCGAGVAFYVARGMMQAGLIKKGQEKWLLDLVAIGTICDSMLLKKENRILCKYGLTVMEKTRRVGLKSLIKMAGVKSFDAGAVGFQIGPRINAAGRMESAEVALRLLMSNSEVEAAKWVRRVEDLNGERKKAQEEAFLEAKEMVGEESVLVVVGDWQEGILGIVAGRLQEEYARPAFVLSETSDGVLKGSGRSFGEFDLAKALKAVKNEIIGGGGHAGACGLKIKKEKIVDFKRAMNGYYESLGLMDQKRCLEQEVDLELGDFKGLDIEFWQEMKRLEPFGLGNLEPVFLVKGVEILSLDWLGKEEEHIRLLLRDREGRTIKMMGFGVGRKWDDLRVGDVVRVKMRLAVSEWQGVESLEGRIVEIGLM